MESWWWGLVLGFWHSLWNTSYMLFFFVGVGKFLEQVAGSSLYECVSLLTAWGFFWSRCAVRVSLLAFSLPCAGVR